MRFHILHSIPDSRLHGFMGYNEVIETLTWGLRELGHEVTYAINEVHPTATNIVFGVHLMPIERQQQLPADSIIYNLEQVRGIGPKGPRSEMAYAARTFQMWEYSSFNMDFWNAFGPRFVPKRVPIGYAPLLERIGKPDVQDIDALIYGMPNSQRLSVFNALASVGLAAMFVVGLYGPGRDALIARSKVVVNLSLYTRANIFEMVRVSYLLSNRKAVAAYVEEATGMEEGVENAIAACSVDTLVPQVVKLATDTVARAELEERGHAFFSQRDIRPILERALAG